jgi:hypothetical protein
MNGIEGARGAWDVPENRMAGIRKIENTGSPPKAVEDGITGNRGGYDGDTNGDDEKNKKYADRIFDLQTLVHDGAPRDTSVKVPDVDTPAAPPAAPSEDSKIKQKDTRSDRGYHPAELHPYIPNASSTVTATTSASLTSHPTSSLHSTSPSASMKDKHGHVHQRTTSITSVGSGSPRRKKVGFFDKVRGEAKVIVGKIEHKKEKVEEGKRILHGED